MEELDGTFDENLLKIKRLDRDLAEKIAIEFDGASTQYSRKMKEHGRSLLLEEHQLSIFNLQIRQETKEKKRLMTEVMWPVMETVTQKMVEEKFQIVLAYQIYNNDWKQDDHRYKSFQLLLKKFPQLAFDLVYPIDDGKDQPKSIMKRFHHNGNNVYHIFAKKLLKLR